ncbi:oxidoreductase [bacterium]|nr:oxidoreductase [bacterium]
MQTRLIPILSASLICACAVQAPTPLTIVFQETPVSASLRGLCAVSESVAWASGSGGTVLRTVDGGETWELIQVPGHEETDFRDIHGWDDRRALIMGIGSPAVFLLTEDGGATWTSVYEDSRPGVFFDGMAFWDETRGIAMSDPVGGAFLLIRTDDGARTWYPVDAGAIPPPLEGEAGFAAGGSGICVFGSGHAWFGTGGSGARVFFSGDWGRSWTAAETPISSGRASRGVFSVYFFDAEHGVAVGGDYAADRDSLNCAAFSSDGGKTWASPEIFPAGFRSGVSAALVNGAGMLVAVGTSGISSSRTLGRTWAPVDTVAYHAVSFCPSGTTGWMAGGNGRIARLIYE